MKKMEIHSGDIITVSGEVAKIEDNRIAVVLPSGTEIWISAEDIKTIRPMERKSEAGK